MADIDETHDPSHHATRRRLQGLRRRLPLILGCMVLSSAGALAYSLSQPKEYTAKAVLLFRDPGYDRTINGSLNAAPQVDAQRQAATNTQLVSLSVVSYRAARALGGGLTGSRVASELSITEQGQADLVGVSATDRDRALAARIANAVATEYIVFRRSADSAKIKSATDLSRRELTAMSPDVRQSQRGRLLRARIDQLETLASLQTGNAELVQRAPTPTSPSAPLPLRNAVLAGALGLLLGLALALILERLDTRVREPSEIEDLVERSVLGTIPRSRALSGNHDGKSALPPVEAEAFRMLRASLRYFDVDVDIRSVLITSAEPGDGKSTVALHLALAAAETGAKTLLLEADLRKPTLARVLGLSARRGLTSVLASGSSLAGVVQQIAVPGRGSPKLGERHLDVLLAGPKPPNPSDLMESERMREIIREAEADYELVVIDTPPMSVVSDAIPLVDEIGGVIVVARIGQTNRAALARLRNQLDNLGGRLLGVVVNSLESYGAGYAYYDAAAGSDPPDPDDLTPESIDDNGATGSDAASEDSALSTRGSSHPQGRSRGR